MPKADPARAMLIPKSGSSLPPTNPCTSAATTLEKGGITDGSTTLNSEVSCQSSRNARIAP
jgi:hypothetical protein